jgi:hypothetical protein
MMAPETVHAMRQLLARILVDDFLQETRGDTAFAVSPRRQPNRARLGESDASE